MSHFLSKRVNRIPPSGIRKFFDIAATMTDVISLGIGEPDFGTPVPALHAGIEALQNVRMAYTGTNGMYELTEAVSAYLERLYGIAYHPGDEVLMTVGVSEGMYLAMAAVLDPGDEVIMADPTYVSYGAEVMLAEGNPILVATTAEDGFQLNPADVERAISTKTKAIFIGYPSNPTGGVMERDRLVKIAELAEKHDLVVISDEIYDRLIYGVEHTHFATLPNMRKRTIVLGGFSKAFAMTGWRLGYAVGAPELIAAMRKIHQHLIMAAPTPAQHAALGGLLSENGLVEEMRQEYDRRRRLIYRGFNDIGLTCFEPKGAFYSFPSIQITGMDEFEFSEKLLIEEQVAVIPGSAFGPSGKGHVRACYATSYEKIEEALIRIERFVKKYT